MEGIQAILQRLGMGTTFDPAELDRAKVESFNSGVGSRNNDDGYDCKVCRNKAILAKLVEDGDGSTRIVYIPCKCENTRISIMRMKRSGLKDVIKDYTFDKFEDAEPWQKTLKAAAMTYAKNLEGWFFIGGQSGCGKTHLCTAICREFLLAGRRVMYMLWRDDVVKIKGAVTDADEYNRLIGQYKNVDILYIDDLFKTGRAADNSVQRPTSADINVAFEIINYRTVNHLPTIISSECTEDELLDIDEAVGGRIFEQAKSFSIAKNRARNYRIRKTVTL